MIPISKSFNHRDGVEGKEKFNKVFGSIKVWRFSNILQNVLHSFFSVFNSTDVNHGIAGDFFPNSGKYNLTDILTGVFKKVFFRADVFSLFKSFRNLKILDFILSGFREERVF